MSDTTTTTPGTTTPGTTTPAPGTTTPAGTTTTPAGTTTPGATTTPAGGTGQPDAGKPGETKAPATFVPPAGMDKAVADRIAADAKEFGWSPEATTKFAATVSKRMADAKAAAEADGKRAAEAQLTAWKDEISKDPALGGANTEASYKKAAETLDKLESHVPGIKALVGHGTANPTIVRLLNFLSKGMNEDSFVQAGGKGGEASLADLLYGGKK